MAPLCLVMLICSFVKVHFGSETQHMEEPAAVAAKMSQLEVIYSSN